MAVADSCKVGYRVGLQLGLIVGSEFKKTELILAIGAPTCQVRSEELQDKKSSQPMFRFFPGPVAEAQVAVEIWPGFWCRQFALVWFPFTPHPWV